MRKGLAAFAGACIALSGALLHAQDSIPIEGDVEALKLVLKAMESPAAAFEESGKLKARVKYELNQGEFEVKWKSDRVAWEGVNTQFKDTKRTLPKTPNPFRAVRDGTQFVIHHLRGGHMTICKSGKSYPPGGAKVLPFHYWSYYQESKPWFVLLSGMPGSSGAEKIVVTSKGDHILIDLIGGAGTDLHVVASKLLGGRIVSFNWTEPPGRVAPTSGGYFWKLDAKGRYYPSLAWWDRGLHGGGYSDAVTFESEILEIDADFVPDDSEFKLDPSTLPVGTRVNEIDATHSKLKQWKTGSPELAEVHEIP